jgi:hypothetical protein
MKPPSSTPHIPAASHRIQVGERSVDATEAHTERLFAAYGPESLAALGTVGAARRLPSAPFVCEFGWFWCTGGTRIRPFGGSYSISS